MLVCDVNADPRFTATTLLLPLVPLMAAGAPLVLTLKLPKRGHASVAAIGAAHAARALGGWLEGFELRHLLANTSNERTLLAYRRTDDDAALPLPPAQITVAVAVIPAEEEAAAEQHAGGAGGSSKRGCRRRGGAGASSTAKPSSSSSSPSSPSPPPSSVYDAEEEWRARLGALARWHGARGRMPLAEGRTKEERELGLWVRTRPAWRHRHTPAVAGALHKCDATARTA
eukprot:COSAG01_NODE_1613_length_9731_cov_11.760590_9_plen_229_part_00